MEQVFPARNMNREYETDCDREKLVHSLCDYPEAISTRIEASVSPLELQVTMKGVVVIRRGIYRII